MAARKLLNVVDGRNVYVMMRKIYSSKKRPRKTLRKNNITKTVNHLNTLIHHSQPFQLPSSSTQLPRNPHVLSLKRNKSILNKLSSTYFFSRSQVKLDKLIKQNIVARKGVFWILVSFRNEKDETFGFLEIQSESKQSAFRAL